VSLPVASILALALGVALAVIVGLWLVGWSSTETRTFAQKWAGWSAYCAILVGFALHFAGRSPVEVLGGGALGGPILAGAALFALWFEWAFIEYISEREGIAQSRLKRPPPLDLDKGDK
jgi:hypothetical protein